MISFEEWVAADAWAWGERVRRKEVEPLELVDAAIARAEEVNPQINAIAAPLYDRARERARQRPEGPLGGVPWVVKDLYQTLTGAPLTNGSRAFAGHVGAEDAELVHRWSAAGLVPICTSTSPEFAISATTESSLYGQTRNPWNLARTSGGSSGGSSALVAAGVVPVAHATDGGGSIRGPASCCGLFGLKPSRGRVPIAPGRTEGWLGCSTTHAVTRSVRDSALLLDATHGPEPGARYVAPPPRARFVDALERPPARLRIAYHCEAAPGVVPDPACVAAVDSAATLCRDLGHEVEPASPRVDHAELGVAFARVVITAAAAVARARARARNLESVVDELEPVTRAFVALADHIPALDLVAANESFMRAALVVDRFMEDFDVILSPTLGRPPVPLGTVSLLQPLEEFSAATGAFSCFTALQNQTGQPAMSVPLYWSDDGLPVGVQFAGRVGEEELLFALARQLEEARPWFDRMPALRSGA